MAVPTRQRADVWLDLAADVLAAPDPAWPAETVVRLLVETFDAPLQRIYTKLGVTDRVGAVLSAQRLGLVGPPAGSRPQART